MPKTIRAIKDIRQDVEAAVWMHAEPFDVYVGKPRGLPKGPEWPPQRVSWIEPMFVVRDKQERVRVRQAHGDDAPTSPRRPDRNAGPLLYVSGAAQGCLLGSGGGYGRGRRQRGARRSISARKGARVNVRELQPLREGCGLRRDGQQGKTWHRVGSLGTAAALRTGAAAASGISGTRATRNNRRVGPAMPLCSQIVLA